MTWTDDRVDLLKKLWAKGLSASQIAGRLGGVTRNAVIGKVHRLGLSRRSTPPRAPAPRRRKTRAPSPPGRAGPFRTSGSAALKSDVETMPEPGLEPAPAPIVELVIPPGERLNILALNEQTCRWPIGDPGTSDFHYCGRQSDQGVPYCEHHSRIAYQPLQDRRRKRRAGARR